VIVRMLKVGGFDSDQTIPYYRIIFLYLLCSISTAFPNRLSFIKSHLSNFYHFEPLKHVFGFFERLYLNSKIFDRTNFYCHSTQIDNMSTGTFRYYGTGYGTKFRSLLLFYKFCKFSRCRIFCQKLL